MVDEHTAIRVAKQEKTGHQMALEGFYGEEAKREAEQRGLGAVVFCWTEQGSKLHIRDMITEEETTRKTFPPKTGDSIFNLHPDDAKPRTTVYLPNGRQAFLVSQPYCDKSHLWLARITENGATMGVEEIDITKAKGTR